MLSKSSKKMKKDDNNILKPFRCFKCGKLLAMENIIVGTVEIKCKSCKELNIAVGEYGIVIDKI